VEETKRDISRKTEMSYFFQKCQLKIDMKGLRNVKLEYFFFTVNIFVSLIQQVNVRLF